MDTANRQEIIDTIAIINGDVTKKETKQIVCQVFKIMTDMLTDGKQVRITDFGIFTPKVNKARTGRNPKTGEPLQIDESNGVSFKASVALKRSCNS